MAESVIVAMVIFIVFTAFSILSSKAEKEVALRGREKQKIGRKKR